METTSDLTEALLNQANFRQLLNAISYPGKRVQLQNDAQLKLQLEVGLSRYSFLVPYLLVDQEVNFMSLPQEEKLEQELNIYTNTMITNQLEKADYLLTKENYLNELQSFNDFNQLRIGVLEDPEKSATLLIEIESFIENNQLKVTMTGPGIKESLTTNLPFTKEFWQWRAERNHEFPLGIDLFIFDQSGTLMAMPRTTAIEFI